jgi:serine/threonine-protein kinase
VADFGIARPADQADETRTILGTAAYLSPEQARGRPTTPASDVYSLGCVLYEMLTGRRPFTGENPVAVAVKHLRHTPPPVEAVSPDAPPALAAVVRRAMEKDPRRRFRDAGAMLAGLEGAATVTGLPERRHPRRLRWLAAALALGAALVLAPAILGFGAGPPEPGERVSAGEQRKAAARVEVPSVVGMSQEEAGRALKREGLVPIFRGAPLGEEPLHVVASQDPAPGSTLVEGSFVTLELVPVEADGGGSPPETEEPADEGSAPGSGESKERPRSEKDRDEPSPSPTPSPSPSPSPTPSPSPSAEA